MRIARREARSDEGVHWRDEVLANGEGYGMEMDARYREVSLPPLLNDKAPGFVVVGEGAEEDKEAKGVDMVEGKGTESARTRKWDTFMGVNGAVCGRV